MKKKILVIGGTRFFGKLLVQGLLDARHDVTLATRGMNTDNFGDDVKRIRVDRRDSAAMRQVFAQSDGYDLIYDQMCYTPLDAAISSDIFAGRTDRYVMASTIEVYVHLMGQINRTYKEEDVDPSGEIIDAKLPWHDAQFADLHYGLGKRMAEARLIQDGRFPAVAVRIGHVLAGKNDFTGRLAAYINLATNGGTLNHSTTPGKSSFIDAQGIADFLLWVGEQNFTGAINAASEGELDAIDIYNAVCAQMQCDSQTNIANDDMALTPYDFPARHAMNTSKASALGYRFSQGKTVLGTQSATI